MKDEVKKILKMVEEKKITAEEGEKLIDALDEDDALEVRQDTAGAEPKFLRVHIVDDEDRVDINLPLSLVEVGLKIGKQFGIKDSSGNDAMKDIDFNQVMELIKEGARGKIVDIKSSDGATVEVYVE